MKKNYKIQYQKAVELFRKGKTIKEVVNLLNLSMYRTRKWHACYRRNERANLEQRFIVDFGCGRHSVNELARKYGVRRQILLDLKHKHYGKGSLKEKRMYQMHLAGIPTRAIADFYNTHIVQVQRSIRKQKQTAKNRLPLDDV